MVIFTLFIGPAIYVSGPTNILAREIAFSYDLGPTATKVMSNRYSLLLMIIAYIIVYVPIMIFAERLGIKKRNKLFKNKNTKSFKN